MRKNVMTFALLAMALVMVLSACGPTPTPVTQAPATPPPATQPPATQPPAPTATQPSAPAATAAPFVFGMLLVGPHNDQGWSQATYDGGQYVEQKIAGSKMLYLENVYSGSPAYPGQTASQLAAKLV